MTRSRLEPTLALLACMTFASVTSAAELHVDATAPAGGDGSIATPFTTVQEAIDAAAEGDDILVAGGTYAAIVVSEKEVHLFGGYDPGFMAVDPEIPSVVEGTPTAAAVTLFESGASILDGFVVRGGQRGVVIDADYLSTTNAPVVRNNVIEQNGTAALVGGGVFADHCAASFIGNTVRDNVADRGAGIATLCNELLVEDNVIEDNVAHGDHGGGLYMSGAMLTVRGNVVRNNEVGVIAGYGWGGGALVYGTGASATFERNVFTDNLAKSLGSAAFVDDGAIATFAGDLFFANRCGDEGGNALLVDGYDIDVSSRATMTNVTIASHDCPSTTGNAINVQAQSTVELVNSIVWGNAGDDFATDPTSTISATYTLSEEPLDGTGNLSDDPRFVAPAAGDFHVRSTKGRFDPESGDFVLDDVDSPTIDAGDPASDFAMEPGPNGLRINLGHTGNTAEASMGGPGGEPPTGDDTSSGSSGADGSEGSDGNASTGEVDDGADATDDDSEDGSSGSDPDVDGTTTIGCACSGAPTTPGWAPFVLLAWVSAGLLSRRAVRRGRAS
jgi:hypothetical protein